MSDTLTGRCPDEHCEAAKKWVESGHYPSVSAFVRDAVAEHLEMLGSPPDVDIPERAEPKDPPGPPSPDPDGDGGGAGDDGDPPAQNGQGSSFWQKPVSDLF